MKKQITSIILVAALLFAFTPFAQAKSGLLAPGTGGTLTPSMIVFTNDGTGMLPSFGANLGSSSQLIPNVFATNIFASTKLGVGTTSPSSIFQVSNAPLGNGTVATTTVEFGSATTTARTCFNVNNTTGASISFYFAGTTMVVENSRCK